MNWLQKISEGIPRILYHATYRANVESILEQGLIPRYICVWENCENGVYLAKSPDQAEAFPETADENEDIPEEWLNDIAVFQVDVLHLDKTLLEADPNIIWDTTEKVDCWIYKDQIPPQALSLLK